MPAYRQTVPARPRGVHDASIADTGTWVVSRRAEGCPPICETSAEIAGELHAQTEWCTGTGTLSNREWKPGRSASILVAFISVTGEGREPQGRPIMRTVRVFSEQN